MYLFMIYRVLFEIGGAFLRYGTEGCLLLGGSLVWFLWYCYSECCLNFPGKSG